MDPISAIVAALVAGAAEAAKPTVVQAVKDAYDGLKALISRKFGGTSTPVQSVEEKPASQTRQQVLKEELTDAHADQDPEVIQGLNALLEALRQHAPNSVSHITTTIQSGGGAVVQGNVNTGGALPRRQGRHRGCEDNRQGRPGRCPSDAPESRSHHQRDARHSGRAAAVLIGGELIGGQGRN